MAKSTASSGATPSKLALQFAGAGQGSLYVGEDVFRTYVLEEVGVVDDAAGLVSRAAEEKGSARLMEASVELLEGVNAGGVECGHVAQAEDDDIA